MRQGVTGSGWWWGGAYERTAFVSASGNNGTAALNDISHPYLTGAAAIAALHAAYPGQTTTLWLLSDIGTEIDFSATAESEALIAEGVTIRSELPDVWSCDVNFGGSADAILNLENVNVAAMQKSAHIGTALESAGTVTGDNATIGTLTLSGLNSQTDGGAGSAGSSGTGSPDGPVPPAPASPPTPGTAGGNFNASGGIGGAGSDGNAGWAVTLLGDLTVSQVLGLGRASGAGGIGGPGGTGVGGAGGMGGDSSSPENPEDGAAGGDGGSVTANGGDGGPSGNGGDGSIVFKGAGVTVTAATLTGGLAANSGEGGNAGSATGGIGGDGGAGGSGGSTGALGGTGNAEANPGGAGANGANGADGSIIDL